MCGGYLSQILYLRAYKNGAPFGELMYNCSVDNYMFHSLSPFLHGISNT